jgi:hypothetical protein
MVCLVVPNSSDMRLMVSQNVSSPKSTSTRTVPSAVA